MAALHARELKPIQVHYVKSARKDAGKCEKCMKKIVRGVAYKWIAPKPRGAQEGQKRIRCVGCDDWHIWEYNPSMKAQCLRIAHDTENHLRYASSIRTPRHAERIMAMAAREFQEFARKRRDSAIRTVLIFGTRNFRARDFEAEAETLSAWSHLILRWRAPSLPKPEMTACPLCSAKHADPEMREYPNCPECAGDYWYIPDEPNDEQLMEWRAECAESASGVLECPL
jgi:hypothetical protein